MFQFPACPPVRLCIHLTVTGSSPAGFPHSDVCVSQPACGSTQLIAACHVLHRRMVPWHPPCALISLIFSSLDPETNCLFNYLLLSSSWFLLFPSGPLIQTPYCNWPFMSNHSLCSCQGASRSCWNGVGRSRLELPTSRLSGECSNRLS